MSLGLDSNITVSNAAATRTHENGIRSTVNERKQRAEEIFIRFRSLGWKGGIPMSFSHNTQLYSLMDIPTWSTHEFVSLICGVKSGVIDEVTESSTETSRPNHTQRLNAIYILLKHCPLICETPNI